MAERSTSISCKAAVAWPLVEPVVSFSVDMTRGLVTVRYCRVFLEAEGGWCVCMYSAVEYTGSFWTKRRKKDEALNS